MFEKVVVGIDDYEAGRDALELANQLVSLRRNLLLVYVEVLIAGLGPRSDPRWQLDDRQDGLERLASVRRRRGLDAELLTVQASSVAGGLHEAVRRHGDLLVIGASKRDEFERTFVRDDIRQVLQTPHARSPWRQWATRLGRARSTRSASRTTAPPTGAALAVASELARESRPSSPRSRPFPRPCKSAIP